MAELEANGRRLRNPRRLTLDERNDFPKTWTPDNKVIIFESDREGRSNIFRQALDQEVAELLVTGPGSRWGPKVTPDGGWILYSEDTAGPTTRIMRIPMSGGLSQVVMEGKGIESFRCARSPATVCLLCEQTPDQKQSIFSMLDPLRGKGREVARVKLKPPDPDYGWDLSPDGLSLAFTQHEEGEASIQLIPIAGGEVRTIDVKGRQRLRSINWTPNGRGMIVDCVPASGNMLLCVGLTGDTEVLWQQKIAAPYPTYGIPSPDGHHIAMLGWAVDNNIWMLENY